MSTPFDIVIVAQAGRLTYEAVLFAVSLRASSPGFTGRLLVAEPQPGALWPTDPRIADEDAKRLLQDLGGEIVPFQNTHFGARYPNGNKVEALAALPEGRPFVFFDTDTLVTARIDDVPFDFSRPSASMAREGTWPEPELYGPGYEAIWRAVYARFNVPFEQTLDLSQPDEYWERYLYLNAGWFFAKSAPQFGRIMCNMMSSIRDDPLPELACQSLNPWLDQVALPVAITALGGGRPGAELSGLDGSTTNHWRALPLLYARASDETIDFLQEVTAPNRIKKVLKSYEPFRRMIYQRRGQRVRELFDRNALPPAEKVIRNRIKRERLWMR